MLISLRDFMCVWRIVDLCGRNFSCYFSVTEPQLVKSATHAINVGNAVQNGVRASYFNNWCRRDNRVFASVVLCLRVQPGNLRGGGGLGGIRRRRSPPWGKHFVYLLVITCRELIVL